MNDKNHDLIKEYVTEILSEYSNLPSASSETISKHFIAPFVRLGKVIAGVTKNISSKAITVVQVATGLALTTFIPFIQVEYDKILENDKIRAQKIKSEYAKVFEEVDEVISGSDILFFAFCYNPGLFLSKYLIQHAPQAAAGLISVLSGGALDDALSNVESKKDLENLLKSNKSKLDYQKLDEISEKSTNSLSISLNKTWIFITTLLAAKSMLELGEILGKSDDPNFKKSLKNLANVPDNDKQNADQTALEAVKQSIKKLFIKNLNEKMNSLQSAGVGSNSSAIKLYSDLINKIKSL